MPSHSKVEAFLALALLSANAGAEEPAAMCKDARVRLEGRADDRWGTSISSACEQLASMPDGDPNARVRIVPVGTDLFVEVTLKDGRSTLRRVSQPAALKPTLEALLTLPQVAPADPKAHLPIPEEPKPKVETLTSASSEPRVGLEIGGNIQIRVAGSEGYMSLAPAGFAQIRANDWLFGMTARWDVIQWANQPDAKNFAMDTVAVGIAVGRRFRASFGNIDVGVSPRLVVESQTIEVSGDSKSDSATDVRLASFVRATFGHDQLQFVLEGDAEISPGRMRRDIRIDESLPALPAWSAGIGAGIVWGEL